jgi:hypothetical protein
MLARGGQFFIHSSFQHPSLPVCVLGNCRTVKIAHLDCRRSIKTLRDLNVDPAEAKHSDLTNQAAGAGTNRNPIHLYFVHLYFVHVNNNRRNPMARDEHNKAAEHHENAAKSHRAAAEQHGKGDHTKGKEHSANAQQHSQNARQHSEQAHSKSQQQK